MGKRGRGKAPPRGGGKKGGSSSKKKTKDEFVPERDMDDEIDAFHKQRDFIPMDVNEDDSERSDDDDVVPVFDNKDINGDEDDEDEDGEEQYYDPALAAKIARQQRFLRQKVGGVEDDMHDDEDDDEDKRTGWGRNKNIYYNADNIDYEIQSDDEELPEEEEQAVLELQRERTKNLSMEDFGLEGSDDDDTDLEPTLEERSKNKVTKLKFQSKTKAEDVMDMTPEALRDLSALPPEEQMEAVYSSAPELVGLLSELNDAHLQLENEVNPLLKKIKTKGRVPKGMNYLKVKQLLLLSYCQAITFYLLLKSEGESTHDHPVMDRIAQVKCLLDKMKKLDENLPFDYKDIFKSMDLAMVVDINPLPDLTDPQEPAALHVKSASGDAEVVKANQSRGRKGKRSEVVKDTQGKIREEKLSEVVTDTQLKGRKEKYQDEAQLGHQSKAMLKFRASLEEKLRQKGILGSVKANSERTQKERRQKVNGQLETLDDYNDDTLDGMSNGTTKPLQSKRLSELVTSSRANKPKVTSGEDDLLERGDIGERRRKHELRVLSKAGIEDEEGPGYEPVSEDDDDDMEEGDESEDSEDEFYQQVKRQKADKLAAKQKTPSSGTENRFLPEETVDGKRHISYQMEKNRGLTRRRKKLDKNPRKKYKTKYEEKIKRQGGQVRKIIKPSGPYGGETSGINAGISRSIRYRS